MKKSIKALVKAKNHANLDSFSFRYGYYFSEDSKLDLFNCTEIKDKYIYDLDIKHAVRASFRLPNSEKTLQGQFILMKNNNAIVTVIRGGSVFKAEEFLSETLRILRKDGEITPEDNVQMYKSRIKSTAEVVKYLSDKIGAKKVKVAEDKAKKTIEKLSEALRKSNERAYKAEQESDYLTGVVISSELEKDEAIERADKASLEAKEEKAKREKIEQDFEKFKAEYSTNQSIAYITDEEQPESSIATSEWNPGVYKLIKAYSDIDNRGRVFQKAVVRIELESENGERFTVKNNWARGHVERIKLANQLMGQQVIYSTWNSHKYSPKIWFKNIALADNQVNIDGQSFSLELEKGITNIAKDVVRNLTHEEHTNYSEDFHYGDDPLGRANTAYMAKDYDKAIELYLEMNEPDSINAAADILFYQGNYEESLKYKHQSAEEGFIGAFGGLAKAYREGWGTEVDYDKSSNWTLKGAEGGDVICMTLAGGGYAYGIFGFEKDEEKGLEWLALAKCYGDQSAERMLNELGYEVECSDDGRIKIYKL